MSARSLSCPVHGIPDCSPLLNGCSVPNRMQAEVDAELARILALLADKHTVEKVAEAIAPGPSWRHLHIARAALDALAGLIGGEGE